MRSSAFKVITDFALNGVTLERGKLSVLLSEYIHGQVGPYANGYPHLLRGLALTSKAVGEGLIIVVSYGLTGVPFLGNGQHISDTMKVSDGHGDVFLTTIIEWRLLQ